MWVDDVVLFLYLNLLFLTRSTWTPPPAQLDRERYG